MTGSRRVQILFVGLGTMVVPFDSAVNIAFPAITRAFAIPIPTIQWVVICYVLTHASLMLAFGRVGDLMRYDLVFRAGLVVSTVGFLLCAFAPDFGWFLAARVLQGAGAALILSCGAALMTSLYPEAQRARALGAFATMFALGSALGPILGGVLVELWGWPAVYWFRAPFALAALTVLHGLRADARAGPAAPFDYPGAVLIAVTLATGLLALTRWSRAGADDPAAALLAGTAVLGFAAFIWWGRRSPAPILDLRLFASPGFSALNAANALLNLASFSVMLLVPYFLTGIAGLPTIPAGLVLAAGPVAMALAATAGGRLAGRWPADAVATAGAAMVAVGLGLVLLVPDGRALPWLAAAILLQGLGTGLFQVAYLDIVTGTMPREQRGVAGSLAMLTRTIGVVVSATTLSFLFADGQAAAARAGADAAAAFVTGFHAAFIAAVLVAATALVATALRLPGLAARVRRLGG